MCGIAGIYGLERVETPNGKVQAMLDAMTHRGPDASGIHLTRNAVLGHRRLSIIDLSTAGNQPFHSPEKEFTLVFNGEIYNYRELKRELSEYAFLSDTDTEVLLAAYMKWGKDCLQKLNGMFAFAIQDNRSGELFLARDRLGIKPLYYARSGQSLVFASEVRAILASGLIDRKLNRAAVSDYLMYQTVHCPDTMVQSVSVLEPGCYMEITDNDIAIKRYWLPFQAPHEDTAPEKIRSTIYDLFMSSVETRLVSDVPFGAFLSGGIDSSLVVAAMSKGMDHPVDTFNISFDESSFSEAKYAQLVAGKYGTNHHEILLKPGDFLQALPDALPAIDHPSGDGPNTWIVSRETKKQGITMALSGLGGDELFAGYDLFKRIPAISEQEWLLSFPRGLRSAAAYFLTLARPGIPSQKKGQVLTSDYFNLRHLYPIMRKVLLEPQVRSLLTSPDGGSNSNARIIAQWESFEAFDRLPVLSRISVAELSTYLQNVLLRDTDQMSMAHSLEVRVPFLDHRLVEYVMYISDAQKFPHTPKKLLVESFADLLPDEIVDRPKMGFVLPWEDWMKNELKVFCEQRLTRLADHEAFNADEVMNLWKRFLSGKGVSWSRLWPLVVLSEWMQTNDVS